MRTPQAPTRNLETPKSTTRLDAPRARPNGSLPAPRVLDFEDDPFHRYLREVSAGETQRRVTPEALTWSGFQGDVKGLCLSKEQISSVWKVHKQAHVSPITTWNGFQQSVGGLGLSKEQITSLWDIHKHRRCIGAPMQAEVETDEEMYADEEEIYADGKYEEIYAPSTPPAKPTAIPRPPQPSEALRARLAEREAATSGPSGASGSRLPSGTSISL